MKKILSFVLAAVALVFTACSNDETIETSGNGQNNKGMVLVATVSQQGSRAVIDVNDTFGTWKFAFDVKDKVVVGNSTINDYYTFTNSGTTFSSADAKETTSATDWYAYYPATTIDLTNQEGTEASAADLYALAGATKKATTGTDGLTINMKAQAAVLRIVKVDNFGPCDIYLKTKDGYVSGLTAKKNEAGFDVKTSTEKVSVLKKNKTDKAGIYYVIVPAGVPLKVYNDGINFKTTSKGLTAGKYYTLTSGPTTGSATAKLADGTIDKVDWVQLWIGGPRIAVKNVAKEIAFKDDVKKGEKYVWGSLWCTPSVSDVSSLYYYDENIGSILNDKLLDRTYDYQDKHGLTLTGKQPGYKDNTLFLYGFDNSNEDYIEGKFLLSDGNKEGHGTTLNFSIYGKVHFFVHVKNDDYNNTPYPVRPILSKETVLWGEQNIQ